jgi:energy-coupling factor transporter transmembrane protein EcfT
MNKKILIIACVVLLLEVFMLFFSGYLQHKNISSFFTFLFFLLVLTSFKLFHNHIKTHQAEYKKARDIMHTPKNKYGVYAIFIVFGIFAVMIFLALLPKFLN